MAKLHSLKKTHRPGEEIFPYFNEKMKRYLKLIPERFSDEENQRIFTQEFESKETLVKECAMLTEQLQTLTCDVVFCHNDLLLKNIIFDRKTNKIGFIDYEFAFFNFQAFDIGNHFVNYVGLDTNLDYSKYPDKEYQLSWIRIYLEEYYLLTGRQQKPGDEDVERLYADVSKCALSAHFFWALCGFISSEGSSKDFDWFGYSVTRLKEYFCRRNIVLNERQ